MSIQSDPPSAVVDTPVASPPEPPTVAADGTPSVRFETGIPATPLINAALGSLPIAVMAQHAGVPSGVALKFLDVGGLLVVSATPSVPGSDVSAVMALVERLRGLLSTVSPPAAPEPAPTPAPAAPMGGMVGGPGRSAAQFFSQPQQPQQPPMGYAQPPEAAAPRAAGFPQRGGYAPQMAPPRGASQWDDGHQWDDGRQQYPPALDPRAPQGTDTAKLVSILRGLTGEQWDIVGSMFWGRAMDAITRTGAKGIQVNVTGLPDGRVGAAIVQTDEEGKINPASAITAERADADLGDAMREVVTTLIQAAQAARAPKMRF